MEYLTHLAILFVLYSILALSLNLVVGYTGLLSIAHAAFFGIGAYGVAILMVSYGWNFFPALALTLVVTGLIGLLIGLVMSRFKDDFYALASVGFNIIVYAIMLNWQDLTRGALGIPGIGRPEIFGFTFSHNFVFLLLCLAAGAVAYILCRLIVSSSFGRVLKAIREDEQTIRVFGYQTQYYKLTIFIIAAVMAGLAGGLLASYITFVDSSTFTMNESIFILAIIILGGLSTLRGSLIGTLFLILFPEIVRFLGFPAEIAAQARLLSYGLLLILLMLYRPQGLIGEYKF